jgi:hypothetical protein
MTGPTFCSHHRELDQPEKQADNRTFQRYKTITVAWVYRISYRASSASEQP